MICKKRFRGGPTLTITNLVPESSVGVWVNSPRFPALGPANQIFLGKACKREGRDIKIQVPFNEQIIIRVRKAGWIPFEQIVKSLQWDLEVPIIQQNDLFCEVESSPKRNLLDRRLAGLRGRTEDIIFYDDRGEDESQSRVISRFPVTYGRTANVVTA